MNMPDSFTVSAILVACCALVLAGGLAAVARRLWQRCADLQDRLVELETAVQALSAGALAGSRADAELRACIARLAPRVENLGHRVPSVQSFQRAIEMAQQGSDAALLMECCGLNRGEADLVIAVHGRRQRAA